MRKQSQSVKLVQQCSILLDKIRQQTLSGDIYENEVRRNFKRSTKQKIVSKHLGQKQQSTNSSMQLLSGTIQRIRKSSISPPLLRQKIKEKNQSYNFSIEYKPVEISRSPIIHEARNKDHKEKNTTYFRLSLHKDKSEKCIIPESRGYQNLFCNECPAKSLKQNKVRSITENLSAKTLHYEEQSQLRYSYQPTQNNFMKTRESWRYHIEIPPLKKFIAKGKQCLKFKANKEDEKDEKKGKPSSEVKEHRFFKVQKGKMYSRLLRKDEKESVSLTLPKGILKFKEAQKEIFTVNKNHENIVKEKYKKTQQKTSSELSVENGFGPWNINPIQALDVHFESNY